MKHLEFKRETVFVMFFTFGKLVSIGLILGRVWQTILKFQQLEDRLMCLERVMKWDPDAWP